MASDLRFDGKVVLITGAGNGLGRAHARLFGSRGAKVVVNDLGGSAFGDGKSASAADAVVAEIRAAGGEAVANYDSVEDGAAIVKTATDAFGRIDVVVNNAGILRDVSFHKMRAEDWDLVYRVHVLGAFRVTHAAWPYMREQGYGRVIFTSSAAGLYGNFGQANYGSAKLAQLGMANTLAVEGRKSGILVNTIAPIAGSRLTETVMPKAITDALAPEAVSPLVAWLAHEGCESTGSVYEVGGGFFAKLRWQRTAGKTWRVGRPIAPEMVRDAWEEVTRFDENAKVIGSIQESTSAVFENVQKGPSKGGNAFIDVDLALGYELPPGHSRYTEKDLAIYALGIGAGRDPLAPFDLSLVYEASPDFCAFPTYAVVPALNTIMELAKAGNHAPGMNYGVERLLHGEQYLELRRPLPTRAKLEHRARVENIWDKGKGAVVVTSVRTLDEDGDELAYNEISSFVRGAGGWGGERGPSADVNVPPDRAPDVVVEERVDRNQALLYRQAGDWNPLHADPSFAKAFGFDEPILHGLCTFGFSVRHVLASCAPDRDTRLFKSVKVRFAESVFPGETLVTEMWKESATRIVFRTVVKERGAVVISNAAVELFTSVPAPKVAKRPEAVAAAAAGPAANDAPPVEPSDVFAVMHDYLAAHPEVAKKVGVVFAFKLTKPDAIYTVDLKAGTGVHVGETTAAGCTLELATADFLALTRGEANPQKLFGSGKLKLGGDMMAAMKLDFLTKLSAADFVTKARARAGAPAGTAPQAAVLVAAAAPVRASEVTSSTESGPKTAGPAHAPRLLAALRASLAAVRGDATGATVLRVLEPDATFTIDFGAGSVVEGASREVTTLVTVKDADLPLLLAPDASVARLFQRGVVRVDGDLAPARHLELFARLA